MFSFKPIYFALFTLILYTNADISDKRLCIDEKCSEVISTGKTLLKYASPEPKVLSFVSNEDVKIYSYEAGSNTELWGVEIKGKRGYVNKDHVREMHRIKRPTMLVNTEVSQDKPESEVVASQINVEPTKLPFEIVDGTKIPLDPGSFRVFSGTEMPLEGATGGADSGESTKPLKTVLEDSKINMKVQKETEFTTNEKPKNVEDQEISEDEDSADQDEDDQDDDDEGEEDEEEEEDSEQGDVENGEEKEVSGVKADNVKTANVSKNDVVNVNEKIVKNNEENDRLEVDTKKKVDSVVKEVISSQDVDLVKNISENSTNKILENTVKNTESVNDTTAKVVENVPKVLEKKENNTEVFDEILIKNKGKDSEENSAKVEESPEAYYVNDKEEQYKDVIDDILGNKVEEQSGDIKEVSVTNTEGPIEREINPPLVNSDEVTPNPLKVNTYISNDTPLTASQNMENHDQNQNISTNKVEEQSGDIKEVPVTSTEMPIEMEIIPPLVNYHEVTPNPIEVVNTYISNDTPLGASQNMENHDQNQNMSTNFEPEFKDIEDSSVKDTKIEQTQGGGVLGGLGNIMPIFKTVQRRKEGDQKSDDTAQVKEETKLDDTEFLGNKDDRKRIEDSLANSLVDKESIPSNVGSEIQSEGLQDVKVKHIEEIEDKASSVPNLDEEIISETSEKASENQFESLGGFFSGVMSFFGMDDSAKNIEASISTFSEELQAEGPVENVEVSAEQVEKKEPSHLEVVLHNSWSSSKNSAKANEEFCDVKSEKCPQIAKQGFCEKESDGCPNIEEHKAITEGTLDITDIFIDAFSSDMFLYLTTTALSVILFLFGSIILDKCKREGPLISRINKLEQQLLTTTKENQILQEKSILQNEERTQLIVESVPNEVVEELNQKLAEVQNAKLALEDQIQALEKELDTSTEVGIELNKIISEILNSTGGSDLLKENIEQMQKKLLEQQYTINSANETLSLRETENHELRLELEISNRKVADLQVEMDKMVEKILKIEDERDQQHGILGTEIEAYRSKFNEAVIKERGLNNEIQVLKKQLTELQRLAEIKLREYNILKESMKEINAVKSDKKAMKSLLEVSELRAQLEQMQSENLKYSEQLNQERETNIAYAQKIQSSTVEVNDLREKYEKADKDKVQVTTKLEVLNNYFKEKEEQMQKDISKYESLWAAKEGEATSTTERIRYMQEELQNYKSQNESLKQEIVNQEVELKSQISVLEKKAHENWVTNRQTERKVEEARQEAAQLRNRLTLRERALAEGNSQLRIQSPLHQNGDPPFSPPPLDPTKSPPPLFNTRDHLTKSPPIPGMPPPPFLPPPLGATPFIPPPPLDGMMPPLGELSGMPPFMPPLPPGMYPGDHRPPPLGRMSSPPPVGSRYTPDSTAYSEYDRYNRRSPSPPYDSEYGTSPPPIRGYSPYEDRLRDDRREYKRPQARSNGRNSKGLHSSGSENDSLGKINKKPQRKV